MASTLVPLIGDRLELHPLTREQLEADLASREAFARALAPRVRVAADWPNRGWEPRAVRRLIDKMDRFPGEHFWRSWLVCARDGDGLLAAGTCGFKGPPGEDGLVEFGYGVVNSHWRRGLATGAARLLGDWARRDPRVRGLLAHTKPGDAASAGVLRKNGLAFVGQVMDPEDGLIDRYELRFEHGDAADTLARRAKELLGPARSVPDRMRAFTGAYWERFGAMDPASEAEKRAGRFVSWCGFYEIAPDAQSMVLVCREPKPACSPIGLHGMCGRGWRERRAFVVRDVRVLGEDYVACDPRDESELVIPVHDSGACVGVFDADSYHRGAFDAAHAIGVEAALAAVGLGPKQPSGRCLLVL
ncbi:MAG TPA: GNAT family N-acetyltransferase [Phycisphaerales bacterium]|nr:GNAT family N-acetyltransferase [Phycisphaerales bacterium]